MKITRLYLVRHGATQMTAEDRFSGAVGAELSADGQHQAARLGERVHDDGMAAVYASPLSRSVDTAKIIAGACGLQPILREELREISHGPWEGLTRREVEERFPADYAAWESDPFTFASPGAESGVAVLARASGDPRNRDRARGSARHDRVAQGDDPARALQPARDRRARLS